MDHHRTYRQKPTGIRLFIWQPAPEDGPLVIFAHGLARALDKLGVHQLPALAALGFRAVAPDMRGYGRSSVYAQHGDYAQEHIVRDMLELIDALGQEKSRLGRP